MMRASRDAGLPDEPEIEGIGLFPELMALFADSAEGRVRRAFDEGELVRDELADDVAHNYRVADKWLAAAQWFEDAHDSDVGPDEFQVGDASVAFDGELWYRATFVEMVVQRLRRGTTTRSEWRGEGDDRTLFVVVEEVEDE